MKRSFSPAPEQNMCRRTDEGVRASNTQKTKLQIDAIYLAQEVIRTCEAKTGRDDILEDQIRRQARAPFDMRAVTQDLVIPLAVKCVGSSLINIVKFEAISRADAETTESLVKATDFLFDIRPPVPGIGR